MRLLARGIVTLLALSSAAACSNLTHVSAPDVTQPGTLASPSGALVSQAGATLEFAEGFNGVAEYGGLISDELTMGIDIYIFNQDLRVLPDGTGQYQPIGYPTLQSARVNALIAADLLHRYDPTPAARIGELFAFAGYAETWIAETMCAGAPLSKIVNDLPATGTGPLTQAQLLSDARTMFDSAIAYAKDSAEILSFAQVGKARALLDLTLDSADAAAAIVAGIPISFSYQAQYSSQAAQYNGLGADIQALEFTVADREGQNGLDFISGHDPRVPTALIGHSTDGKVADYMFTPINSASAPITVASGVEAQLIIAEAALHRGNVTTWANTLNALRAAYSDTALSNHPLTPDSTTLASAAGRVDVLFRERAMWLFLTGHRQGDLRRLIRQYGRDQSTVFPTGPFPNSSKQYGSDVNYPITGENNDRHALECLNRDA